MNNPRVIDITLGFNELDLFEIRFFELCDVVDHFYIVEFDTTFSGKKKPLYFRERAHAGELGDPWEIIREKTTVLSFPCTRMLDPWSMEHTQRRACFSQLPDQPDATWYMLSDMDEIPNKAAVTALKSWTETTTVRFEQQLYYFYLDARVIEWAGWIGTKCHYGKPQLDAQAFRNYDPPLTFKNAGWHFSYMGGMDRVKEKIKAYAHQEYNTPTWLETVAANREQVRDPFGRDYGVEWAGHDHLPAYVKNNKERFQYLLWKEQPT